MIPVQLHPHGDPHQPMSVLGYLLLINVTDKPHRRIHEYLCVEVRADGGVDDVWMCRTEREGWLGLLRAAMDPEQRAGVWPPEPLTVAYTAAGPGDRPRNMLVGCIKNERLCDTG